MNEATIKLEKQGGVAMLTLNRPDVFNALNSPMRKAFIAALDACQADPSVRCVVITGAGKAFCAGQDLGEIVNPETAPSFEDILEEGLTLIALKIRALEKPVIAAINGVAAGAGATIAYLCDISVATEGASFIQSFSKIGLIPDAGGTWSLPRLVGFARASALMMTGEKISAADAVAMGMISACYPAADFEKNVQILAQKLAEMPTKGFALTKKALNESCFADLEKQLATEARLQKEAAQTHDYTEGVRAFVEKRPPVFFGR